MTALQIAPVRKSIIVQATTKKAFDVFTAGIDRWWPKTHGIGEGPVIESVIEPFVVGTDVDAALRASGFTTATPAQTSEDEGEDEGE